MRHTVALLGVFAAGFLGTPATEAQTGIWVDAWEDNVFISVNFAYQGKEQSFTKAFSETVYDEVATYEGVHQSGAGGFFDISGGVRMWRNLAVGLGVTTFSTAGGAAVTGSVPHPLFFNQPRTAFLNRTDLEHKETGIHLQAVWVMPITDRIDLSFSGGPSFFSLDQGAITGIALAEVSAPFEVVDLIGATTSTISASAVGSNVGVDVTYMVTEQYGGGLFVRWAGASVDISDGGAPQSLDVGGVQFGIGLRARF